MKQIAGKLYQKMVNKIDMICYKPHLVTPSTCADCYQIKFYRHLQFTLIYNCSFIQFKVSKNSSRASGVMRSLGAQQSGTTVLTASLTEEGSIWSARDSSGERPTALPKAHSHTTLLSCKDEHVCSSGALPKLCSRGVLGVF